MYRPVSGRGAAWLARPSGGRKVESSNLSGPTIENPPACQTGMAGGFVSGAEGGRLMSSGVLPAQALRQLIAVGRTGG